MAAFWYHHRPWPGPPPAQVAAQIVDRMEHLLSTRAEACPGAHAAVALLAAQGVPLALASSSAHRLIAAALRRLDLVEAFAATCSAQDQPLGKPHPGVYLAAAEALGIEPRRCVAIEDSLPGVIAAAAAGMGCVAVPQGAARGDPRFALADRVLPALTALDLPTWQAVLRARGL